MRRLESGDEIGPERLGALEADMDANGARADAEGMGRVRPGLLLEHDLGRHHEALVAAPAHPELEEAQRVAEGADVDAFGQLEGKEPRGAAQPRRQRAEAGVEKSKQRAAEAATDQEHAKAEAEELGPRIEAQRNEVAATPSEEATKALDRMLKDRSKAQDKERRAMDDERKMKKKAEDLEWEIRRNVEDQERKSAEITRQEELVGSLREKLAGIR